MLHNNKFINVQQIFSDAMARKKYTNSICINEALQIRLQNNNIDLLNLRDLPISEGDIVGNKRCV